MINLAEINLEMFEVTEKNNLWLITPGYKSNNKSWNLDEIHMRSILCTAEGKIVSSGFPKFFNYGEHENYHGLFLNACADNPTKVLFAPKIDGSLVIRSIINGEVNIRTRGSHKLEPHHNEWGMNDILPHIKQYHSKLLDPTFCPEMSLLFEFTGPNNKIIIKYTEAKLTFLGTMLLEEIPRFIPVGESSRNYMKEHLDIDSIPMLQLNKPLDQLQSEIEVIEGEEGVVVYAPYKDSYLMAKMKSDWYIKIHNIVTGLSDDTFRKMIWESRTNNTDEFRDYLIFHGYDYEIYLFLKEKAIEWYVKIEEAKKHLSTILAHMDSKGIFTLATRKEKSLAIMELQKEVENLNFDLCIWFLDGQEQQYLALVGLDMTLAQYRTYLEEKAKKKVTTNVFDVV